MSDKKFGEEFLNYHLDLLENRGLTNLTGFYDLFESKTVVEDGEVVEFPIKELVEHNPYFDERDSILLLNAFILGVGFEQKYPHPKVVEALK